jgi:GT2 family glycosyltransferase
MQTLDSVRAQSHTGWQLHGVYMGDAWQACPQAWREAWLADPRFHWAPEREPSSGPLPGRDLQTSGVDWCWWLPVGDQLAPQALSAVAQAIQTSSQAQVVYTDQDFIDRHGLRCNPYFKPDWSPDLFEQFEYTGRASVWHRSVWECSSWPSEGGNPLAVLSPCLPLLPPDHIVHCPVLAYHQIWTGGDEPDAMALAQGVGVWRPFNGQRVLAHTPKVSIIVPTRDARHLLAQCIDSIHARTTYKDYEIIVVDNGSTDPDSLAYFAELQMEPDPRARVLRVDGPFNYSAINNAAVTIARGEVLIFLNNDIEITTPNWLQEMVFWATRSGVGCVGAKLHFPNHRIQHAGIVLGMGGVAGHAHRGEPSDNLGYFGRLILSHNVSAVTGAAMAVQKQIFEQAGRFDDDQLPVAYNDVDLCLKVRALGYRNVYTPWAQMLHHESATRGEDTDPVKRQRLATEEARVRERWGNIIDADPMYNPHLSLHSEHVELAAP